MTRSIAEKIDCTVLIKSCHGQFLGSIKWLGLDIWKRSLLNNQEYLFSNSRSLEWPGLIIESLEHMTTQQAAALDFMNKLPTNHFIHKRMSSFLKSIIKKKIFSVFSKSLQARKKKDQIQQKTTAIFSHHNKYLPLLILSGLYRSKNIFRKGSCSQNCICSFWKIIFDPTPLH